MIICSWHTFCLYGRYTFESIANENSDIMKRSILIAIVVTGMMSSCSQGICPTYMHHPDQQKDIRVKIDKPINQSVREAEKAS